MFGQIDHTQYDLIIKFNTKLRSLSSSNGMNRFVHLSYSKTGKKHVFSNIALERVEK